MKNLLGVLFAAMIASIVACPMLFLASCSAGKPNGSTAGNPASAGGSENPSQTADASIPAPPEGAQFTILCYAFTSPSHIIDAAHLKDQLNEKSGLTQFYVVHTQQESDLFYGYYKTFDDRTQTAEYARAHSDRDKVAALLNDQGDRLFPQVIFVPINMPDPSAPPEWELSHNPGYWTLQIGIYRDDPQRKQAAVDSVKAARAQGIEAYYQHGLVISGVFIGSWPKEAARIVDSFAASKDPNQPVLVLSGSLPGADNADVLTPEGQKMHVDAPKLEVFDPTLKKAIADYPYTYVNGVLVGRKNNPQGQPVPYASYLIRVPHGDADQDESPKPADQPPPGAAPDSTQSPPPATLEPNPSGN